MKAKLKVEGMMCSHCEKRVTDAVSAMEGVKKCSASAKKGEVSVDIDESRTSLEAVRETIKNVGYKPAE